LLHFDYGIPRLKQSTRGFMPKVMKTQIVNFKEFARLAEGAAD
jgi:hypothetical protein